MKPSYEIAAYKDGSESSPRRRFLTALYNDYHEANERNDDSAKRAIEDAVPDLLDEFDQSDEVRSHDNAEMLRNAMRAGWHFARGEFLLAYDYDFKAWNHAESPPAGSVDSSQQKRRMARYAANLCAETRYLAKENEKYRQEMLKDSVEWGRKAVSLDETQAIYVAELAMSLDDAGYAAKADELLQIIIDEPDFTDPHDALAVELKYEGDLLWRTHLAGVRTLLAKLNSLESKAS